MIFVDNNNIPENSFLNLLSTTKAICLESLQNLKSDVIKLNGDRFEEIVFNCSVKASENTEFQGHVIQTGPHAFPDIIAKQFYGMEVKVTKENKWSSTGNSILETTRVEGVERIYMFFGKLA